MPEMSIQDSPRTFLLPAVAQSNELPGKENPKVSLETEVCGGNNDFRS